MSVRQRAVDLLYAMCDRGNVEEIVHEMLVYLEMADYSIREEMVSPRGDMFDVPLIYHDVVQETTRVENLEKSMNCSVERDVI